MAKSKPRKALRYLICLATDTKLEIERVCTLDHAIVRACKISVGYQPFTLAVVDTEEPAVTRVIAKYGKAQWAVRCTCEDGCLACDHTKIAPGEPCW